MGDKGSLKLVAHRGDAKTLLAFDLQDPADRTDLAGFSIFVEPPGLTGYYLWNRLTFERPGDHAQMDGEPPQSSANAPIHKFRWLHVPGTVHQGIEPAFGLYRYTVTPRYFDGGRMTPPDRSLARQVVVDVRPFRKGPLRLGFTRGFVQSQAFARRFGTEARFRPDDDALLFDTEAVAGQDPDGLTYTWNDMYEWCGFTARDMIFEMLDEVAGDPTLELDVFAYDLDEPDVARMLLDLAPTGRVRVILDSADLHHDKAAATPEDVFEAEFRARAGEHAVNIKRGRFGRYSHDKVLITRRGGDAAHVLTGSTNFSVTGLYVNSNHVLRYDDPDVAAAYAAVFDLAWDTGIKEAAFAESPLSKADATFAGAVPDTTISFSPHRQARASEVLGRITDRVEAETARAGPSASVLFAVMELGPKAQNPVYENLSQLHASQDVYSMGVSDNPRGIYLYEPGKPDGFLVSGRPGATVLPPPFGQIRRLGQGHQIHHKFVVAGFNGPDPTVFCGSSNLALGGEQHNGDNLLMIRDKDVATAFAIEAMALVDLFQFLDRMGQRSAGRPGETATEAVPAKVGWFLGTSDAWTRPYWDPADVKHRDRRLFAS